jgi:hypothetical protein
VPKPRSRLDTGLRLLQVRGVSRGVLGSSRPWFWVAVVAGSVRLARRLAGREEEVVYRGNLRPGESLEIEHRAETYAGRRVRSRRRAAPS